MLSSSGAVFHSHAVSCNLVTQLAAGQSDFRISHQEMIKGIDGHGFHDELVIPIIDNTAWEYELTDSLAAAMARRPRSPAVLVRQHGLYVWGKTWEQAKRHAECLHYLFEVAVQQQKLGLTVAPQPVRQTSYTHLLLDIEGTTTPISFVKDILFPFSQKHFERYLKDHWSESSVQEIVTGLLEAAQQEEAGAPTIPAEPTAATVAAYASYCVDIDRKLGPMKALQGLIWDEGYASGELQALVFEDVARRIIFFAKQLGVKVCIYSSGSRKAQQLLFRYSDQGDLTPYLTAYFDTKMGMKQQTSSYTEIALTLGVPPEKILFVTDVLGEAKAAAGAGVAALVSVRPGNAPISEEHNFKVIRSFEDFEL